MGNKIISDLYKNKIVLYNNNDEKILLTLTLDNGIFSSNSNIVKCSSNCKQITIEGSELEINTALQSLTFNVDAKLKSCVNNGNSIASTINIRMQSGDTVIAEKMHIFIDDAASSFFDLSGNEYAFVNSLNGLKASSFASASTYTDDNVIDAEKRCYVSSNDTLLCWAGTASNMLTWTDYGNVIDAKSQQLEDAVFDTFRDNFSDNGSYMSNGVLWFLTGAYSGYSTWAQPKTGSGNYVGMHPRVFSNFDSVFLYGESAATFVDELSAAIFAGNAVGLTIRQSIFSVHAITCWGLSFNSALPHDDPNWLTGFYITDSDDSKYQSSPTDRLRHVTVTWDAEHYRYTMTGYDASYYWQGGFASLAKKDSIQETLTDSKEASESFYNVTSGHYTVDFTLDQSSSQHVSCHGVTYKTTLGNGAVQIVSNGGIAKYTYVSGGIQYILNGGVAIGTTITLGTQSISQGGSATSTILTQNGKQNVYTGGVAIGTTISSGGTLTVGNALVQGGLVSATTICNSGSLYVSQGGVASNTTILSGGAEVVCSGGLAQETTISDTGSLTVMHNGIVSNATIAYGGYLYISGGVATGITQDPGAKILLTIKGNDATTIVSGKNASGTFSYINGIACNFLLNYNQTVSSGGIATATTISSGGHLRVCSGGIARLVYVAEHGYLTVSSGGQISQASVKPYAELTLHSGALASNLTIDAGGVAQVSYGASSINAYISGNMTLVGTATSTTVQSKGILTVQSGALASNVTIETGGSAHIAVGANATTAHVFGNMTIAGIVSSITIHSGGVLTAQAYARATNLTVETGGVAQVALAASSTDAHISGTMTLAGQATSTTVHSGGILTVQSGAIASNLIVESGGKAQFNLAAANIQALIFGSMNLAGQATSTTVYSGGILTVQAGAYAHNATIATGGIAKVSVGGSMQARIAGSMQARIAGSMLLEGNATSTTVHNGGILTVQSGALTSCLTVESGGNTSITFGARDIQASIAGSMTIAGQATSTTVHSGGILTVQSGAVVSEMTIGHGGTAQIAFGANNMQTRVIGSMFLEGTATSTIVQSRGILNVQSGAHTSSLTIDYGGTAQVAVGASNMQTYVIGSMFLEGSATSTMVQSKGILNVQSGARTSSLTIDYGGTAQVAFGAKCTKAHISGSMALAGTATSLTVQSRGMLTVHAGAIASYVTIEAGGKAQVSYDASSMLLTGTTFSVANSLAQSGLVTNTTIAKSGSLYGNDKRRGIP